MDTHLLKPDRLVGLKQAQFRVDSQDDMVVMDLSITSIESSMIVIACQGIVDVHICGSQIGKSEHAESNVE